MERVLVVEDDFALRIQISFSLEEKYKVFEAANAEEARAVLASEGVDVVILDLGLPPAEHTPEVGISLLKHVLDNHQAKVIVLTGQKTEEAAVEAIKYGAFDYLMKPASMEKLIFSIDRALLFRDTERRIEEQGIKKISFDLEVGQGLQPAREEAEKNIILKVLRDTNFNVYKSAKILGVKRESLYYFLKKFGIKRIDDQP